MAMIPIPKQIEDEHIEKKNCSRNRLEKNKKEREKYSGTTQVGMLHTWEGTGQ